MKIIQITALGDQLIALDDEGHLWSTDAPHDDAWFWIEEMTPEDEWETE